RSVGLGRLPSLMELGRLLLMVRLLLLPLLQRHHCSSVLMGGKSGTFARRIRLASHPEGSTFPPSRKSRST
ncbi:hypothetical protein EDB85DRAFT_1952179, partial [Lactarius pseudohatsudake]